MATPFTSSTEADAAVADRSRYASIPIDLLLNVFRRLARRPPPFSAARTDHQHQQHQQLSPTATSSPDASRNASRNSSPSQSHHLVSCRWLRLACLATTSLHLTRRRLDGRVSTSQLVSTVWCFPNLTSVHIDTSGADLITDAALAEIAAACPRLERLSLFPGLSNDLHDLPNYLHDQEPTHQCDHVRDNDPHTWTSHGLDSLFQACTRLEELALDCPPTVSALPATISTLTALAPHP